MPDLDWLKAVKERPEDAAAVLRDVHEELAERVLRTTEEWKSVHAAARVQTVAEADADLAVYCIKTSDRDSPEGNFLDLVKACREARAREKGEQFIDLNPTMEARRRSAAEAEMWREHDRKREKGA